MLLIPKTEYFQHPAETWNKQKCEKIANSIAKDGLGTPYPFRGYIGSSTSTPPKYGSVRYNGGCIRNEEWYQGEFFPLPIIHDSFEIIFVPTWGYRLVKKNEDSTQ